MSDTAPTATPVYRREIPFWGEPFPNRLKGDSLKEALASYILEANHEGYHPNPHKVLAVKLEDRNTTLRNVGTPVRNEVYFVVEGEVFPQEGTTRLAEGQSPADLAELLVEQVYEKLWIWAAYDFSKGSGGGFRKPFEQPPIQRGSANPNPERKTRRTQVHAKIDARFSCPIRSSRIGPTRDSWLTCRAARSSIWCGRWSNTIFGTSCRRVTILPSTPRR